MQFLQSPYGQLVERIKRIDSPEELAFLNAFADRLLEDSRDNPQRNQLWRALLLPVQVPRGREAERHAQ